MRQELADLDAGDRGGDRAEGPPWGVPGLGSQLSSWLMPPSSQIMSTWRCFDWSARATSGRKMPPAAPASRPSICRRESAWSLPPHA
jgi:hypothetical protein